MKKQYDLEVSILSCILQKPELMKKVRLEDSDFKKTQRLWQFMKSFYEKFETFDLTLMFSVCKNQEQMMMYFEWLWDCYPSSEFVFEKLQDQMIKLRSETKRERMIADKVFKLANDFYVGQMTYLEFLTELNQYIEAVDEKLKDTQK